MMSSPVLNSMSDMIVTELQTKVYPRNSIENARRVRQLAHTIQGLISSLAGKRVARHLPKVVGAWLAGLYDNDRLVSRSVVESISQVFPTDEKRNGLWKIFQTSILEFVDDVILHQTVLTLSDERIVKPDDAEAKYARVSATAILLFNRILSMLSETTHITDFANGILRHCVARANSQRPINNPNYSEQQEYLVFHPSCGSICPKISLQSASVFLSPRH